MEALAGGLKIGALSSGVNDARGWYPLLAKKGDMVVDEWGVLLYCSKTWFTRSELRECSPKTGCEF